MNAVPLAEWASAASAFDALAGTYDATFTNSLIGRAQRNAVWREAMHSFRRGDRLLELNCGTGEDALFFARQGISVVACDASAQMIATAEHRAQHADAGASINFCHLAIEDSAQLHHLAPFDAVFSNFSGLNCVRDFHHVAYSLASLVRPNGSVLLCLSARICLAEIAYYLLRGNPVKAVRRLSGHTRARLAGHELNVYYPTVGQLRRLFTGFDLLSVRGIGVAIPPSYMEKHITHRPRLFSWLCRLEPHLASLPLLRTTGDHMLLHLRRRSA